MSEKIILIPKMYDLPFHRGESAEPARVYGETVPSFFPPQEGGRLVVIMFGSAQAMGVLGRAQGKTVVCEVQPYQPYENYEPHYVEELMCMKARRA